MQLVQKYPTKTQLQWKRLGYFTLVVLAFSCKPFFYRQGFGLAFDYEVAISRVQRTADWIAFQLASDNKPTVVLRKGAK